MNPDADNIKDDNSHNNKQKATNQKKIGEGKRIDFNRDLPALPLGLCLELPPNLSLQPTPHPVLQDEISDSPTRSTHERTSKESFRNTTRELLRPFLSESPPKACDPSDLLDPVKPGALGTKKLNMQFANQSYHSIAELNPFLDNYKSHITQMDEFYESRVPSPVQSNAQTREPVVAKTFRTPKGMSQSRSENNIHHHPPPPNIHPPLGRSATNYEIRQMVTNDRFSPPSRSPSRSRMPNRTPSPNKLDNIHEDQPMDFTPSPPKRSRSPVKQLFGEHGWLGRTTSMKEVPNEEYRKSGFKHWSEKIKQRFGGMTGDVSKLLPGSFHSSTSPPKFRSKSKSPNPQHSKFPVSLDPPAQSKLYSEIELMVCATANQYLLTQSRAGRMSVESFAKTTARWVAKNRPQVIEFQFDQLTQRDLVLANIDSFRFYGPNAENPVKLNAMMLAWRSLAKDMAVRTFCTPDSVLRKQMHDVYRILEMLGAPLVTFLAFQEIQVGALGTMREMQRLRDENATMKFGVERKWEPEDGGWDTEIDNPFA